jgi:outer membrane receptor for Fe3+-dicitrate
MAIRNWYWALYVNDEIKLGRLTLNAGLRYDVEEPRTERYNRFATFDFQRSFPIQVPGLSLRGVSHPGRTRPRQF